MSTSVGRVDGLGSCFLFSLLLLLPFGPGTISFAIWRDGADSRSVSGRKYVVLVFVTVQRHALGERGPYHPKPY